MQPENRALLALGLLLLGAVVATESKTSDGAAVGAIMMLGGAICIDPEGFKQAIDNAENSKS